MPIASNNTFTSEIVVPDFFTITDLNVIFKADHTYRGDLDIALIRGNNYIVLATDIAGVGGLNLPVEVSAIDSFPSVTDAPERSLSIVARISLDLADVYLNNDDQIATALDRCKHVSLYLLEHADSWLGDDY